MKKLLLSVMALCVLQISFGQNIDENVSDPIPVRAQSVFLEGAGPSLIVGLNYDTRFQNRRDGIGGRVGAGYLAAGGSSIVTVPVMINYLLGKQKHYFEVGLGATFATRKVKNMGFRISNDSSATYVADQTVTGSNIIGTSVFGYRYQPLDNGFQFRAGFSPVFDGTAFIPYWPYLSVGYTF